MSPRGLLDTAELVVERVAALQPEVILDTRAAASQEEHDLLSRIAPTVHAPAGTPAFGTEWRTQVRTVAAALGRQDAGESVVGDLERRVTAAADAHPELAGRTAVAAARSVDGLVPRLAAAAARLGRPWTRRDPVRMCA